MGEELVDISTAVEDFRRARRKAALQELIARLRGESVALLSYEEVRRKLQISSGRERGLKDVPLDAIVGSVGRYSDFTRTFLPREEVDAHRWARVKVATMDMAGLPPVELYRIGDAYFVSDGNHRVSVAREIGATHIQAYVTEIHTDVDLTPDTDPDDLILKAEYADFLRWSDLRHLLPDADLILTAPGKYADLKEHISVHRYYMGLERRQPVDLDEAVVHWYEAVYTPIVEVINRQGMLRDFPDRTETDLYLWIAEHHATMEESLGWGMEPAAVVEDLVDAFSTKPERVLARVGERIAKALTPESLSLVTPTPGEWRRKRVTRYGRDPNHLFQNIMVALDGRETGWAALEQAIQIAQKEQGRILGLHIVGGQGDEEAAQTIALRQTFWDHCSRGQVAGELAVSTGTIAHEVSIRARWVDLLVAPLNYPPGPGPLDKLRSGFRTMIVQSPCPVLALPGPLFPLTQAVLAFDGSPKSLEALYVTAYLARCCPGLGLVIVSCDPDVQTAQAHLEQAETYLASHSLGAETVAVELSDAGSVIRDVADTHAANLIVMGGYSRAPLMEIVMGSTVNDVLRTTRRPTLICQ